MYRQILPLLLLSFLISCKKGSPENNSGFKDDQFVEIDVTSLKASKPIKPEAFIKDFSFLTLKGVEEEDRIVSVRKISSHNDLLYLFDIRKSNLLAFDQEGNFIKKIGTRGGGPKEYRRINDFILDKKRDKIYLLDNPFFLTYSTDGEFISKDPLKSFYPVKMGLLDQDYLLFNLPTIDETSHHVIASDLEHKVVSKLAKHPEDKQFMGMDVTGGINNISDNVYYTYTTSSIIHKITKPETISPIISFDLGKDTWPEDKKFDIMEFRREKEANRVSFLHSNYYISNDFVSFEYSESYSENSKFGYYDFDSKFLVTSEESPFLEILKVPVGKNGEDKVISSLDYENYLLLQEDPAFNSAVQSWDPSLQEALNSLNYENTTLLMFYNFRDIKASSLAKN